MEASPFAAQFPEIYARLQEAIKSTESSGPLDRNTQLLIRLGVCAALQLENAFRAYAAQALSQGIEPDQIDHAVLTTLGIIGFPRTLSALTWAHRATGRTPFR